MDAGIATAVNRVQHAAHRHGHAQYLMGQWSAETVTLGEYETQRVAWESVQAEARDAATALSAAVGALREALRVAVPVVVSDVEGGR